MIGTPEACDHDVKSSGGPGEASPTRVLPHIGEVRSCASERFSHVLRDPWDGAPVGRWLSSTGARHSERVSFARKKSAAGRVRAPGTRALERRGRPVHVRLAGRRHRCAPEVPGHRASRFLR